MKRIIASHTRSRDRQGAVTCFSAFIARRPRAQYLVATDPSQRVTAAPARLSFYLGGLLAIACVLPGQTVGPVHREGRYWVQVEEGSLPGGGRLRIQSVGSIAVAGADSKEVRYKAKKKLKARNATEAEQLFQSARLTASRQGSTAVLSIARPELLSMQLLGGVGSAGSPHHGRHDPEHRGRVVGSERPCWPGQRGYGRRFDPHGSNRPRSAGDDRRRGHSAWIDWRRRSSGNGGWFNSTRARRSQCDSDHERRQHHRRVRGGQASGGNGRWRHPAPSKSGAVSSPGQPAGRFIWEPSAVLSMPRQRAAPFMWPRLPLGFAPKRRAGRIRLENVAGAVWAASASGSIDAYFLDAPLKPSFLETNAGAIVVWLPATLAVTIEATVDLAGNANRIRSDFPVIQVQRDDQGFGSATLTGARQVERRRSGSAAPQYEWPDSDSP